MSFHLIHFTKNLHGYEDVNLYLPVGTEYEDMVEPGEKFQTLWLLHGFAGNFMEWHQLSSIEKLAMLNKFAVVSVDGDNSMYNDMPNGDNYYTYITDELPAFLRKHFPLSDKREDNFIAGLSMGGNGAAKIGFTNPDKYGAIGIFSSGPYNALQRFEDMDDAAKEKALRYQYKEETMKPNGFNDTWGNFLKLRDSGYPMPLIYDACGRQDFAFEPYNEFKTFVKENGREDDVIFEDWDGVHNWEFWDVAVHKFVELLPLKDRGIWRRWYNERHPEAR